MIRTFVEVPLFTKRWKEIGLSDDELLALQIMLLKDPESGPVMEPGESGRLGFLLQIGERVIVFVYAILILLSMKLRI